MNRRYLLHAAPAALAVASMPAMAILTQASTAEPFNRLLGILGRAEAEGRIGYSGGKAKRWSHGSFNIALQDEDYLFLMAMIMAGTVVVGHRKLADFNELLPTTA